MRIHSLVWFFNHRQIRGKRFEDLKQTVLWDRQQREGK
jgi:hypothetical protein